MLKVVIQASGQRPHHLSLCKHSLYHELLVCEDLRGSSKIGMFESMQFAVSKNATHILIVQEDTIACKDFIHTVENLVEKYPDKLISYFTPKVLTGGKIIEQHNFCYAQSYSLPTWMAKQIINFTSDKKTDDGHINEYLVSTNQTHLITNPSLVEHLGWDHTTLPNEKAKLQTYDKRRMAGKFIGLENSFEL